MPITVICDECQLSIRVRDSAAGKRFRCKGCGNVLVVKPQQRRHKSNPAPEDEFADDDYENWDDDDDSGDEYEPSPQRSSRRRQKRRQSASAQGMPRRVKGAVYGLVALGLFFILICLARVAFVDDEDKAPMIAATIWGLFGVVSGIMLWKQVPGAKAVAIIFSIPMFCAFPLGTLIAWKIVSDVVSDEAREYLAA